MAGSHPENEILVAFAEGRLPAEDINRIESHLLDCDSCCLALSDLKDDTFIRRLQEPTTDSVVSPTLYCPQPRESPLPQELAEHSRYRVLELIGRGGMGTVYRAEHRMMHRTVAIKIINSELVTRPLAVERFQREVQAAAKLSHPNIVTAYDAEQAGNLHLLVMEYVDGTDLATLVHNSGPLSIESACRYVIQAALGLQHAHEKGMVHRDIKPHNLMLTAKDQIRILDFGLASLVDRVPEREALDIDHDHSSGRPLTSSGLVMGTPDYMAPEQALDPHSVDIRADIYSLGCTLYFLLKGNPPFQKGSAIEKLRAHAQSKPDPLSNDNHQFPETLSAIVERMMERDLERRFQTPQEVADALTHFLETYKRGSVWNPRVLFTTIVSFLTLSVLLGIIYVKTDYGTLVIETADDQINLLINSSGVTVEDEATGRRYQLAVGKQTLGTGSYRIDVNEVPDGLQFSSNKFTLSRGDTQRLRVTLQQPASPNEMDLLESHAGSATAPSNDTLGTSDTELSLDELTPDGQAAVAAANTFLHYLDEDKPVAAFEGMSSLAQQFTQRSQFERAHRATTQQYGKLKSRKLQKAFAVLPIPGLPPGDYFTVQFRSDFERQAGHWEFVMLDRDQDGQWRVNAHGISSTVPSLRPLPD